MVYIRGASYKKPKKPAAGVSVVSSTGPLHLEDLGGDDNKPTVSWGSRVNSVSSSVSGLSDVENLENLIAEETSYVDSGEDDKMDETILYRTHTRMYVLEQSLKAPLFITVDKDDDNSVLLPPKVNGSNQLPSSRSRVLESHSFRPVKSFALDVDLLAVPGRTNDDKLITIKKVFYKIDGFGRVSTPSKFPGVIYSTFTSKSSLIKAREMASHEKIIVNGDLRKPNIRSDWEVIVKEIPVDLPKSAIEAVFSKFGKIISIKVQLIGLWQKALVEYELSEIADLVADKWSVFMGKDSVRMAKTSVDRHMWVSRDQHQTLLYTLPVGTTAYDLSGLVKAYDGKTCFIGHNPTSYVHDRCVVICFECKASKLAAIGSVLVFKGVSLCWTGLSLACCTVCKQFSHVSDICSMSGNSGARSKWVMTSQNWAHLANVYKRKQAPIAHPVFFGGKIWAQVAGGSTFRVVPSGPSGIGANFGTRSASVESSPSDISVSAIAKKLSCVEVVSSVFSPLVPPPIASTSLALCADLDMALDVLLATSLSFCPTVDDTNPDFGSSSSKVLTAKVGGLKSKLMALDALVGSVLARLDVLCSGLGSSEDIVCWHKDMGNLVSIFTESKLKNKVCSWIINKFDSVWVFISGLNSEYLGADVAVIMDSFLARHVCKISEVPGRLLSVRLLFKNKHSVSILGLYAGAFSVIRFFQVDEINSLIAKAVNESSFIILRSDFNENGTHRSASFKKCFDLSLVNFLVGSPAAKMPTWENFRGVKKTIDYVFVSPNLVNAIVHREVLNISEHFDMDHQAVSVALDLGGLLDMHLNFLCSHANRDHWKFDVKSANRAKFSDMNAMWNIVHKIMVFSVGGAFKKKWFKGFDSVFTKSSSRFHKLELLVFKLVKASRFAFSNGFASLLEVWHRLDFSGVLVVKSLFLSDSNFDLIRSVPAKAKKSYRSLKFLESKHTKEFSIKQAIGVLERSFRKVVLDHLVVGDKLILEPVLVKSKVDEIMEGWTRKCEVVSDLSEDWVHQYWPLDYMFDGAFSDVMCSISFNELSAVVKDLPDGKAAGLSGISNELWKHCDKSVLDMLLVLLNFCLVALIEMACKILSKILSDRISLAYSTFDVLCGDNFSVLKGMMTQSLIFAIVSVIENALEKNHELWLVLQDIVMTDFGLTDGYCVYDGLDQGEVFSPLFWHIFYDSLLCKVKRQDAGLTLFFTTGAFVDDTIWIGSSQAATQHILDVASEFFRFNDISVNNDKTVTIFINCWVVNPCLTISGAPISIAKKEKFHRYLGIFLSFEGLLKPSLAKAQTDVRFFVNLVLRKAVSDKQCAYLVSTVLFPIISYRTQFSFVFIGVCSKWDALVHKILKSKSGLPCDFSSDALHHPFLYNLKTFKQIQAKSKLASVVAFANSAGVLAHIGVSPSNNFLAGVVHIFSGYDLSLGGFLTCVFHHRSGTPMSLVLSKQYFFKCVFSLRRYEIAFVDQLQDCNRDVFSWRTFKHWKRLDPHGPVLLWFDLFVRFLGGVVLSSICFFSVEDHADSDVHLSHGFGVICNTLMTVDAARLSVYMDGSLSGLGTVDVKTSAAVFFEDIDLGLGVGVSGLVSSTLVELQAMTLALECVSAFHLAAMDACKLESLLVHLDFRNRCWIECHHIANVIRHKNLEVNWIKRLSYLIGERFLRAGSTVVSGNSRRFVHNIFCSVHHAHWEIGSGSRVVVDDLHADINWFKSSLVWHPDSHLAAGFTNMCMAGYRTYFIKALYCWLPVAVWKCLYNKRYPSIVCLYCGDVEISDHVFSCSHDATGHVQLLDIHASAWEALSGLSRSSLCVLQLLASYSSKIRVGVALLKGFDSEVGAREIVNFVHELCLAFQDDFWLVHARHRVFMKKHGLILHDGFTPASAFSLPMVFSAGVVRLLGVAEAIGVGFRFPTVGPVIAVMKKTIKVSGSEGGLKTVASRKKRKGDVLEESVDDKEIAAKALGAHLWGSETDDTMKSESINMEEECLVEETSIDYGESGMFMGGDPDQTPKSLCVKTKKVLRKPLGVIDYDTVNVKDDVLDNFFLLPPPLPIKPSVLMSVCKSFALNIDLVTVAGKFFQEKLSFFRKIFSGVSGFGGASTPSKFGGIICATFTSEETMMAAARLANDRGVIVNTNLKCPSNNRTNWAIVLKDIPVGTSVEAVCTAVSEFGVIKMIKMQLVDAIRVARADIDKHSWDVRDRKSCFIGRDSVSYSRVCCTTVCFDSKSNLFGVMVATPVIKGVGLCWSCLFQTLCAVCEGFGHTSFSCRSVKSAVVPSGRKAPLLAQNQFRLAKIYAKKSALISRPLAFNSKTWASVVSAPPVCTFCGAGLSLGSNKIGKPFPPVVSNLEFCLVRIKSSLVSLIGQIGELAKKLKSLMLAVSQPSPGHQLLVTSLSQNQGKDIVIRVGSGEATSNKIDPIVDSLASPHVVRLKNMLDGLSRSVMSLSAHFDSLTSAGSAVSLTSSQ
ncbi:hypothetical protein G9A89_017106 [Geosiphon pyriformis]|nr:hypothetical protein G9A89_017106 [Geosiphon pyriformis]